ncbi:MAG: HD-GYP domain-containing protein [Lachnospiraceae bacterium]|nr:HD-GYP domain-containing protein [Lachnospiraceae bacterium]
MAKTKTLFSFELESGMIVAEDVYRSNGTLLFPKHTMLNDLMIAKLPLYNIMELPIVDGPLEPEVDVSAIIEQAKAKAAAGHEQPKTSYVEKLKSSEDFKEFTKKYDETVGTINKSMEAFVNGEAPLEPEQLVDDTLSLISKGSSIRVFDMLQTMKSENDSLFARSTNTALISATIGRWLGLSQKEINDLTLAGLLHDLGMTKMPKEIIDKPGKLTDEEFETIKTHPRLGYDLVRDYNLDTKVKEAILLHHERCDGSGYPFGVSGNKITMYAKIVMVADVYDAITSKRSYRDMMSPFQAIEVFEKEGLHRYDPRVIMTFLENIGAAYVNNFVRLTDGRVGEVIMLNKNCLSRPVVRVEDDFIDLTQHPELSIEEIV